MEHEATLRFVTNLDRDGIEQHLAGIADRARQRELVAVAALLDGVAGLPRADLDRRISQSIALLRATEVNKGLVDQLEMVQINLPNLAG